MTNAKPLEIGEIVIASEDIQCIQGPIVSSGTIGIVTLPEEPEFSDFVQVAFTGLGLTVCSVRKLRRSTASVL